MGAIRISGMLCAAVVTGLMNPFATAVAAENFVAAPGYTIIAPEFSVGVKDGVVDSFSQTKAPHFLFHLPGVFTTQPVDGNPVDSWQNGQPFRCERSAGGSGGNSSTTRLTIYADGFPLLSQPLARHTYLRVIVEREWWENGTQRTSSRTEYRPIDVRIAL